MFGRRAHGDPRVAAAVGRVGILNDARGSETYSRSHTFRGEFARASASACKGGLVLFRLLPSQTVWGAVGIAFERIVMEKLPSPQERPVDLAQLRLVTNLSPPGPNAHDLARSHIVCVRIAQQEDEAESRQFSSRLRRSSP